MTKKYSSHMRDDTLEQLENDIYVQTVSLTQLENKMQREMQNLNTLQKERTVLLNA